MYLPYCVNSETYHGKIIYGDEGPFNNGVFYSTDSGVTWQMEQISADYEGVEPKMAVQNGVIHLFYAQGKWDRHRRWAIKALGRFIISSGLSRIEASRAEVLRSRNGRRRSIRRSRCGPECLDAFDAMPALRAVQLKFHFVADFVVEQ